MENPNWNFNNVISMSNSYFSVFIRPNETREFTTAAVKSLKRTTREICLEDGAILTLSGSMDAERSRGKYLKYYIRNLQVLCSG